MEAIETLTIGDLTVNIYPDENVFNPREDFEHVGQMVCWHSRYNLGDKHSYADPDAMLADIVRDINLPADIVRNLAIQQMRQSEEDKEEMRRYLRNDDSLIDYVADSIEQGAPDASLRQSIMDAIESAGLVILPLHLYDHSGITMSTGSFSCPWDSGQVGYIYALPDTIKKEWGEGKDAADKARQYLENEVKEYDQYLTGDVYYYTIENEDENLLGSCGGFYGLDWAIEESTDEANAIVADDGRFIADGI